MIFLWSKLSNGYNPGFASLLPTYLAQQGGTRRVEENRSTAKERLNVPESPSGIHCYGMTVNPAACPTIEPLENNVVDLLHSGEKLTVSDTRGVIVSSGCTALSHSIHHVCGYSGKMHVGTASSSKDPGEDWNCEGETLNYKGDDRAYLHE